MKGRPHGLVLWILIPFTAVIIWLTPGWAEEKYPSRPIHVVVGYAAGGATDIITRALIEPAKEILGRRNDKKTIFRFFTLHQV